MNKWYEVRLDSSGVVDEETVHYWLGGQLVATREGGGLKFTHTDHLGSSSVATDLSGAAVAGSAYYPYGEHRSSTGAFGTARDFTGQYLDTGTGLHFYNARYYDSALGRFISADGRIPGRYDPRSFNRYSYVYNNPLKYTDPEGHWPWSVITAAVSGGVELGFQLWDANRRGHSGLAWSEVNWVDVAQSTAVGAIGGGLTNTISKVTKISSTAAKAVVASEITAPVEASANILTDVIQGQDVSAGDVLTEFGVQMASGIGGAVLDEPVAFVLDLTLDIADHALDQSFSNVGNGHAPEPLRFGSSSTDEWAGDFDWEPPATSIQGSSSSGSDSSQAPPDTFIPEEIFSGSNPLL